MLCCYTNCCNSYTANMFCVILMSQHVADTSFNLTRFAIFAGTQRILLFLMFLRCRLALPKHAFVLQNEAIFKFVSALMYFAFAAYIAYSPPDASSEPSPVNSTLVRAAETEDADAIVSQMKYISSSSHIDNL